MKKHLLEFPILQLLDKQTTFFSLFINISDANWLIQQKKGVKTTSTEKSYPTPPKKNNKNNKKQKTKKQQKTTSTKNKTKTKTKKIQNEKKGKTPPKN